MQHAEPKFRVSNYYPRMPCSASTQPVRDDGHSRRRGGRQAAVELDLESKGYIWKCIAAGALGAVISAYQPLPGTSSAGLDGTKLAVMFLVST